MWQYNYVYELYHYGIKGMKLGVRRNRTNFKSRKLTNIGTQFFANKISSRKTIKLPKKEYAHVMSELATNVTKEQKTYKTIIKCIGKYVYTFENNFNDTYRVIGKTRIISRGKNK